MRHKPCIALLALLAVVAGLAAGGLPPARAAGFIVNVSSDDALAHDANPGDGVCADIWATCSLRAAIEEANALAGPDTITFAGQMTIYVSSSEGELPALNDIVTIDASAVWDTLHDAPGVTLDGAGANVNGLALYSMYNAVYGLHITNFGLAGIWIGSSNNTIGSSAAGKRNVLSGNGTGLRISGSTAYSNVVQANYIGLAPSGTGSEPNAAYGVFIDNEASLNVVGGDQAGEGNYISGNGTLPGTGDGVAIGGTNTWRNELGGNYIGLAADNITPMGNSANGVHVMLAASETYVGKAGLLSNAIAHNGASGVLVDGADNTDVRDNLIRNNGEQGIYILNSSLAEVYFNTITANTGNGVLIRNAASLYNQVVANAIYDNVGLGIDLADGGNMNQAAPTITAASVLGAAGTAVPGSRIVYVYSDNANEGAVYHGQCLVNTSTWQWSYSGALYGPNVTAIAADVDGNTSEFSAPFYIGAGGQHRVFLPYVASRY